MERYDICKGLLNRAALGTTGKNPKCKCAFRADPGNTQEEAVGRLLGSASCLVLMPTDNLQDCVALGTCIA